MNNQTEVSIKFKNFVTGEKKLETYAQTLTKIQGVLSGIDTGVITQLETSAKTTKTINEDVKDMAKKVNIAFNYTTIRSFTREMANLVRSMSSAVSKSASYLENMNLLDVAYNNNTVEADRLVNKLSEMYGLDESWGYRTVGIFKQLANAMGLTADAGDKLSRVMTQFAIDTSSLYNIDVQDTVSILQSALAGQTKPARRLGADITQNTLQKTLDNEGIQAYIGNLSYVEKRLLIVASLLQQVSEANNDWGRTIESVANQTRIMSEQWDRLTRAMGNLFLPVVKTILPYLNAILMVLTEIISSIAVLFGYDPKDYDFFGETDSSVIDLQENLSGANEEAKKLNKSLRGFDKLNVITTPSSTSSGIGSGGINQDIMDLFDKTANDYMSKLTDVEMKATKIRDKIMAWLGFTKQINEETGDVSFKFEKITGGTMLGAFAFGGSIYMGINSLVKLLNKFGLTKFESIKDVFKNLKTNLTKLPNLFSKNSKLAQTLSKTLTTIFSPKGLIILGAGALVTLFIDLYKNSDEFREKVDKLGDTLSKTLSPIIKILSKLLSGILTLGVDLYNKVLKPIVDILKTILAPLLNLTITLLQTILDILNPILEVAIDLLGVLFETIITPLFTFLINIAKPILDSICWVLENTLVPIIELVGATLEWLDKWIIQPFIDFWITKPLEKYIISPFKEMQRVLDENGGWWENWKSGMKSMLEEVGQWWDDHVTAKIQKAIEKYLEWYQKTNIGKLNDVVQENGGWLYNAGQWWKNTLGFANGGLPQVGQIFYANERGPELVGQIGGQSFVANQNQMMDLLDKKIGNANSGINSATFIVQVGDEEIARKVVNDLQGMAKTNGQTITIG